MRASLTELRSVFSPIPPETIWQELLDTDIKVVKRLCGLSSKPPREYDLDSYLSHLRFMDEIQSDLLLYLFPSCMEKWQRELVSMRGTTGFTETFHATLSSRRILESVLSPLQREQTLAFMRNALLDRLEQEHKLEFFGNHDSYLVYQWVGFLVFYGVVATDIERLWEEWWAMKTVGHAVAALQYVSCLIYPETENPIFKTWTPTGGGGPPWLWECESLDYDCCWREENCEFLKQSLNVEYLREKIALAVERLKGEEVCILAQQIEKDFSIWTWLVESRAEELPKLLALSADKAITGWSV